MNGKSISILGCGWLGIPLFHYLKEKRFDVKGSTRTPDKIVTLKKQGISPVFQIDIDIELFDDQFFESDILIINITSKNIEAYRKLISKISASVIKKVLFVSSTSVYDPSDEIITEETPTNQSPLAEIEKLFLEETSFQTTVVRFAGLIGYDRHPGNFFNDGRIIPNPEGRVNMIHRDDCIDIIYHIVHKKAWGQIFNGVSDDHRTRRDYYTAARKALHLPLPDFKEDDEQSLKLVSGMKVFEKFKLDINRRFEIQE